MHIYDVEEGHGDVTGRYEFCSNSCHQMWIFKSPFEWAGWNGCHESEFGTHCDECGTRVPGAFADPEAV